MTKIDPIIAVRDVEASSEWYQSVFGCKSMHGGKVFDVLVSENDEILICLHKWGEHQHPTMINPGITPGNGLILYFRTENMNIIYENALKVGCVIEEDIHLNPKNRAILKFFEPLPSWCLLKSTLLFQEWKSCCNLENL